MNGLETGAPTSKRRTPLARGRGVRRFPPMFARVYAERVAERVAGENGASAAVGERRRRDRKKLADSPVNRPRQLTAPYGSGSRAQPLPSVTSLSDKNGHRTRRLLESGSGRSRWPTAKFFAGGGRVANLDLTPLLMFEQAFKNIDDALTENLADIQEKDRYGTRESPAGTDRAGADAAADAAAAAPGRRSPRLRGLRLRPRLH